MCDQEMADMWKMHGEAFERHKQKLLTFSAGDRVTRPYFYNVVHGPIVEGVKNGIFIEAIPPVDCLCKFEDEDQPSDYPISLISHA